MGIKGMGFLCGGGGGNGDKNVLKLNAMVAQFCEYTKND